VNSSLQDNNNNNSVLHFSYFRIYLTCSKLCKILCNLQKWRFKILIVNLKNWCVSFYYYHINIRQCYRNYYEYLLIDTWRIISLFRFGKICCDTDRLIRKM